MLKTFSAYIVDLNDRELRTYETVKIKAKSKDKAWDKIEAIAFNTLFKEAKFIVMYQEAEYQGGI